MKRPGTLERRVKEKGSKDRIAVWGGGCRSSDIRQKIIAWVRTNRERCKTLFQIWNIVILERWTWDLVPFFESELKHYFLNHLYTLCYEVAPCSSSNKHPPFSSNISGISQHFINNCDSFCHPQPLLSIFSNHLWVSGPFLPNLSLLPLNCGLCIMAWPYICTFLF